MLAVMGDAFIPVCSHECGEMVLADLRGDFPEAEFGTDVVIDRRTLEAGHFRDGDPCGGCGKEVHSDARARALFD